jgi:hypothetical protein
MTPCILDLDTGQCDGLARSEAADLLSLITPQYWLDTEQFLALGGNELSHGVLLRGNINTGEVESVINLRKSQICAYPK